MSNVYVNIEQSWIAVSRYLQFAIATKGEPTMKNSTYESRLLSIRFRVGLFRWFRSRRRPLKMITQLCFRSKINFHEKELEIASVNISLYVRKHTRADD